MGKVAKNKTAKTMRFPEGSAPGCSQGGVLGWNQTWQQRGI